VKAASSPRPLRVVTYNIHKGVSAWGWRNRVHEVRIALATLEADLLFLQEVQEINTRNQARFADWPAEAQTRFLASEDYHHVYGGNAYYQHGHHGNAILSLHPFVHSRNYDISDHRFEQRGMLHAVIEIEGRATHVINVHFGLFASSRRRQAEALVELVAREVPQQEPLIIAGDFNDWNNRLSQRLIQTLGVNEAAMHGLSRQYLPPAPARTFPALMPWLQLDRIYVRGLEVVRAQVKGGPRWARISDHAPLVADLTWK
jgi:endonuclease/exonuclease/phosphatase family metal-dependent hydrolase